MEIFQSHKVINQNIVYFICVPTDLFCIMYHHIDRRKASLIGVGSIANGIILRVNSLTTKNANTSRYRINKTSFGVRLNVFVSSFHSTVEQSNTIYAHLHVRNIVLYFTIYTPHYNLCLITDICLKRLK